MMDTMHPTEKASAVRQYLQNVRRLKSLVFGMVEGERRPGRPVWRWLDDILMWYVQDMKTSSSAIAETALQGGLVMVKSGRL